MFTGIIAGIGVVSRVTRLPQGSRLRVQLPNGFEALGVGDSLAIDGACLTAVGGPGAEVEVEAIAETLRRTTLGQLEPGSRVNLEPALAIACRSIQLQQGLGFALGLQKEQRALAAFGDVELGADRRLGLEALADFGAGGVPPPRVGALVSWIKASK